MKCKWYAKKGEKMESEKSAQLKPQVAEKSSTQNQGKRTGQQLKTSKDFGKY